MLMFWVVAGLLLAGALLPAAAALWAPAAVQGQAGGANVAVYRDQLKEAERDLASDVITPERFEQLRGEIQRRVLEDTQLGEAPVAPCSPRGAWRWRWPLLIPAASIATYLALGEPDATAPIVVQAPAAGGAQHEVTADQIQRMVSALAERLKAEPDNAEGWLMLGRSYTALGRYTDAVSALPQGQRPDARQRQRAGRPGRRDGHGPGPAAGRRAGPAGAAGAGRRPAQHQGAGAGRQRGLRGQGLPALRTYWERLQAVLPADSEMARSVQGSIAEATQLEGGAPAAAARPQPPPRRNCGGAASPRQPAGGVGSPARWCSAPNWPPAWLPATPCSSLPAPRRARACRWPSSSSRWAAGRCASRWTTRAR
jgi:cytochrome c-type biogenesis protein CcmH